MSEANIKKYFAVIDTETNWDDKVMSIGLVIADDDTFSPVDTKYYIITPECNIGGMYSFTLEVKGQKVDLKKTRKVVIQDAINMLTSYNVNSVFAYNARFDYKHLPELNDYAWFDIMQIAANITTNKFIPRNAECYSTGRLKRGYSVEAILQMLTKSKKYSETHNALYDALDELKIIKLLGHRLEMYNSANINDKISKGRPKPERRPREIYKLPNDAENSELLNEGYAVGVTIYHKAFGRGKIKEIIYDGDTIKKVLIDFYIYGMITLDMPKEDRYIERL